MAWWRNKAFECPECGWQGTAPPAEAPPCPECGAPMFRRSWSDTWGLTLLILASVVTLVLFVAYFGRGRGLWD